MEDLNIFEEDDIIDLINLVEEVNPVRTYNIREKLDYFHLLEDREFFYRFRLRKNTVVIVLEAIKDNIKNRTERNLDRAISPMDRLLLTLRFLATRSFYITVGDFIGIHKTSAARIITKVITALCRLSPRYIFFRDNVEDRESIQRGFYEIARFPRIIGAVDCTHIKIQSPGGDQAETFRNRKGYFSLNVQVVCDADLKIRNLVCRWPGSAHDNTIFENSAINMNLENGIMGNALLIGDRGYALRPYLITPLDNPEEEAENIFNESLIRSRNVIERVFGIWKRRFPVLSIGIRCKIPMAQNIIVACAILHNVARNAADDEFDGDDYDLEEMPVDENNVAIANGEDARREIINYFRDLL